MFSTSITLLLGYLGAYLFLPILPGGLALLVLGVKNVRGLLFYIISWFVGVGIVGYGIFLLQFVRYGVDLPAYFILIGFLFILLLIRTLISKDSVSKQELGQIITITSVKKNGRNTMNSTTKIKNILLILLLIGYFVVTFYFVTHFPSYGDDSFGNRHVAVVNMIYEGGFKVFGNVNEVLARGRLGYPIMMGVFQALVGSLLGGYNDIYVNLFQWISVILFIIFLISIVFKKTNNVLYSLIGPVCIISLPLIFLHTTQGYMDLLSGIYASIAIYFFYASLQDANPQPSVISGMVLLAILSYVKNDGIIIYAPSVLLSFIAYLILAKKLKYYKKMFQSTYFRVFMIGILLYFIIPFTYLKLLYDFSFNPTAGSETLSGIVHREIVPVIWKAVRGMNNYGIAPQVMLVVCIYSIIKYRNKNSNKLYLLSVPVFSVILFTLVFLLTENYKYVLDQTTVNRVYTMSFVMFFSILPLLIHDGE